MPSRSAHAPRNTRLPALSTASPSPARLLSSHTFTLIASWRGQLLICTVVLVVGAIYFVLREPIKQWRRRQRERLSRALTAELLNLEKRDSSTQSEDRESRSTSSSRCVSSALPSTPKTARERGRERRKEAKEAKKRSGLLRADSNISSTADTAGAPTSSSIDSSPALTPISLSELTDICPPGTAREGGESSSSHPDAACTGAFTLSPPTITLECTASDTETSCSQASGLPTPPSSAIAAAAVVNSLTVTESPSTLSSPRLPSPLEVDLSTDGDEPCSPPTSEASRQVSGSSRPSYSRQASSSYSTIPDDGYLPMLNHPKKKNKRKSKARGGAEQPRTPAVPRQPSISALRTVNNISSDDASSPRSVSAILSSAPGSPSTPRRRRKASIGGLPMTPALDVLLTNHDRTIDSLRAEIGHAKAEECKARDDEVRAREELRRSRATEDRMRSDYERARKTRDRAEHDTRRMEAEVLLMRNRFDTLSHMYNAVCSRLRDFEIAHATATQNQSQSGGDSSVSHQASSPLPSSPYMAYPTLNGLQMGLMPYPHGAMYGSPMTPHGGFAMRPPVSHSPLRRTEGPSSSDLAGPLTTGIGPSNASSQLSSPFPPSELTINTSLASTSSSNGGSDMSAVELRRLHIASSVLKKKTPTSESGYSNPNSTQVSEAATDGDKTSDSNPVAGLGITQLSDVSSTFPSVNGNDTRPTPSKHGSLSSSTSSSDASSAPPGRQILTTPSIAHVYPGSGKIIVPESLSMTTGAPDVFVGEPESVDEVSTHTPGANGTTCSPIMEKKSETNLTDSMNNNEPNDRDATADDGDAEYVPMFASLAHTPEQLAEIARMRESAIRDRARRSRQRSTDSHDL